MRLYKTTLLFLWVLVLATGCAGYEKIKEIDERLEEIEIRKAQIEEGGVAEDEQAEYNALNAEKIDLLAERKDEAEKIEKAGGISKVALTIAGIFLGMPILIAVGDAIDAGTKSAVKKRK